LETTPDRDKIMTQKILLSPVEFHDQLSDSYDQMLSWQTKLGQEGVFFKKLTTDNKIKSSLSVACNTGFYVIMLRRMGLDAVGIDSSPKMIDRAKANALACGVTVDFVWGDYENLPKRFSEGFDMVTFMADSISHVKSRADAQKILQGLYAVLNPGGFLVLQTRNYELILKEQDRFQPPITSRNGADETLFFRLLDFTPKTAEYSVVRFHRHENLWTNNVHTTEIYPYLKTDLESNLKTAGFKEIQLYRNFNFEDFDKSSTELVLVAHKKGVLKPPAKAPVKSKPAAKSKSAPPVLKKSGTVKKSAKLSPIKKGKHR
jgi:SAM-dependent methyltransferase